MKRKLVSLICLWAIPLSCWAANFVQVYQDACANDPTYKAARAEFHAINQDVPISVANFMPQVDLSGRLERVRLDNKTGANPFDRDAVYYNNRTEYELTVRQSIFNFANWALLAGANARAQAAGANLCAAAQDLIIRTSEGYFAVLLAADNLRFIRAEKKSFARQLRQTKERFKVGLIAITALHEAQASYDATVAQEISAENELSNRMEELREITGKSYRGLMGVRDTVPLIRPIPSIIQTWVDTALKQNYTLKAACFTTMEARENIKLQFSGHLPVVDATGGFSYQFLDNPFGTGQASKIKRTRIGVEAFFPVLRGGAVMAATTQADYLYQQACAEYERTHRSVISNTRKSYLGVISGISQVKADKQAITSRNSALEATQAAYDVGTRTMVDVLNTQSRLTEEQRNKSRDMYEYLIDTLRLKQAAGTLTPCDIVRINRWLNKRIDVTTHIR